MTRAPVIVIGAGAGGLSAAALLANAGEDVLVLERAAAPGGKMRTVAVEGLRVDAGPTVFTMRWVFEALFESCGESLGDAIGLTHADLLARHAWRDGARLDLFADRQASEAAIGDAFGAREAAGYRAFMSEARRMFETLDAPFLRASRPNPVSLSWRIGMGRLPDIMAIKPFEPMMRALSRHFAEPKLRQLFGRYATYSGASPWRAPATLMLIAAIEQAGVWLVDGGMHAFARALAGLAERQGACFRYGAKVSEILVENGRARGVRLTDGETIAAHAVVFNGDPAALATGLLGDAARKAGKRPPERSLSALVWTIAEKTEGFPLAHHNVFFSNDYAAEFADLAAGRVPRAPTVYLCAQDRDASGARAPPGPERMQLIVNAPAMGQDGEIDEAELAECETRTFDLLKACGLRFAPAARALTTPAGFEALFPATGGALYGAASHGWMAAFRRPGQATKLPGLYLAGGATHPGAGVPMAALSGRLAAEQVLADLGSTRAFRREAMAGGMSTRSARTASTG